MATLSNTQLVPVAVLLKIAERIRDTAIGIAKTKHAGTVGKRKTPILIGKPTVTRGQIRINLLFSKDKRRGSPDAAAYEWGSGIHATRGASGKYVISPISKRALWFPYPEAKIYPGAIKYMKRGVMGITTEEVHHPGVAPRPFLEPAKKVTRQQNLRDLREASTENIRKFIVSIKKKV